MPLRLPLSVARWIASLGLIKGDSRSADEWEVSFDDQLYLENGYLVGQLLRLILQTRGHSSDSLLRIRKIAHISSNENWRIIDDILQELSFPQPIDHHSVSLPQLQAILQFLHDHFAPHQPAKAKRQKKLHLQPTSFKIDKPLSESTNLLQFFILALHAGLAIPLSECLGLLISDCRYWQQLIRVGTTHLGYQPVLGVYQAVLQEVPTLQRLLNDEVSNTPKMLSTICSGVMSESAQICNLACVLMDNLEQQQWVRGQGLKILLKSPHRQAIDLLLRKVEPNFHFIFNQSLPRILGIRASQFLHYAKLLKHLKMSIYAKQVFEALPLSFYLRRACEIFQPDQVGGQTARTRLAARQMLAFAVLGFWSRLNHSERSQIYFGMDSGLCRTDEEKLNCVAYLFEIVKELQDRQGQAVLRFFKIIHRYYAQGNQEIRNFVLDNYGFMLKTDAERFPVGHFLQNYDLATIVQAGDYQLLHALSQRRELTKDQVQGLLKTGTIYYYQQLQGGCFLEPLKQLVKQYTPVEWGKQVSTQILSKWPQLNIPAYQPLPPQSQKIKFRSIGLKRKEMLQFTELNRYKALLGVLTQLRSSEFLTGFAKLLSTTILKVQKSKSKEMHNTSKWLNKLLAQIDSQLYQLKLAINPSELQKRQQQSEQSLVISDQDEDIHQPPNLLNSSQNEFMRDQQPVKQEVKLEPIPEASPLLPFSQQQFEQERDHCQDSLYEQFELTYIRNLNTKYSNMVNWALSAYERSANIQHFLRTIHLDSHFKEELEVVKNIEDKLKLTHEDPKEIVTKLLREMGLLLFNFKKGRRITVKCLQSFYDLIVEKNKLSISKQPNANNVTANLDFSFQILPKLAKSNKQLPPFAFCFEIVSSLLNRALGVQAVQPVSCLITQIAQIPVTPKLKKMEKSVDLEEEQLQQLEKLIEQEVKPTPTQISKLQASTLKKSVPPIVSSGSSDGYQKWAQVQKKVALRRLEMQKGVQKSLNS